jgi:hypothetical protein
VRATSLNPIWTVQNGSLFILNCTAEQFFAAASGLSFFVKDYDVGSSNELVGKVDISQTALLEMATGERTEVEMQSMGSFKPKLIHFVPKLVLRVRKAEPADIEFMKQKEAMKKSKKLGIYADHAFLAPTVEASKLLRRESKFIDGVKKVCGIVISMKNEDTTRARHPSNSERVAPTCRAVSSRVPTQPETKWQPSGSQSLTSWRRP